MSSRRIAVLAFLICAAMGVALALLAPFPGNDEVEHVSFAATMQDAPTLQPQYQTQLALDRDDLQLWTVRHNYIGHPVPYYLAMALFLDRTQPTPQLVVRSARLASLMLVLAGIAAALRGGLLLLGNDRLATTTFCGLVALCPAVLATTRMVNNDALAVLGGALVFYGLAGLSLPGSGRWEPLPGRLRQRAWHDMAVGAGLMLAMWAKPNAGLETGLLIGLVIALRRDWRPRLLLLGVLGGVLGALPYLDLIGRYGKLVPIAAEDISIDTPRDLGWGHYIPTFFELIGKSWGFDRAASWPQIGVVPMLTTLTFWALLLWTAWSARRGIGPIATAALAVLLGVLGIHLWFSATRLGFSLTAPAFRYYLPLWPALAYAVACVVSRAGQTGRRAGAVGAAVLTALGWAVVAAI